MLPTNCPVGADNGRERPEEEEDCREDREVAGSWRDEDGQVAEGRKEEEGEPMGEEEAELQEQVEEQERWWRRVCEEEQERAGEGGEEEGEEYLGAEVLEGIVTAADAVGRRSNN